MASLISATLRYGTVTDFTKSALRQLSELYQFRAFSMTAFMILRDDIKNGRRFGVGATGRGIAESIDQDEFLNQLSTFDEKFVLKMTFLQLVDVFEHWLFHALRAVLAHPHRVFEKSQIDANLILKAKTLDEVKFKVVDHELDRLRRKQPADWFQYIGTQLRVELPPKEMRASVREIKATRDVWVHNNGYANDLYFEKAGAKARVEPVLNARLDITPEYHQECWALISEFITELGAKLAEKFDDRILSYYETGSTAPG